MEPRPGERRRCTRQLHAAGGGRVARSSGGSGAAADSSCCKTPAAACLAHSSLLLHPPAVCAQDKFLKFKYDASTVEAGKAFAKSELQREAGLPVDPSVPVFGFIGGWRANAGRCQGSVGHGSAGVVAVAGRPGSGWVRSIASRPGSPQASNLASPPQLRITVQAAWRSRRAWTSCWPPSRSCPRTRAHRCGRRCR